MSDLQQAAPVATPQHHPLAEYIEVIPAPDGPWFTAEEVCKVLGLPLSSSNWMPTEIARKVENMDGRKVQAINALGIFALCSKVERRSSNPAPNMVNFLQANDEDHTALQRHQIRAARALINALLVAYPQKPQGSLE